jgi:hypothetical protein
VYEILLLGVCAMIEGENKANKFND